MERIKQEEIHVELMEIRDIILEKLYGKDSRSQIDCNFNLHEDVMKLHVSFKDAYVDHGEQEKVPIINSPESAIVWMINHPSKDIDSVSRDTFAYYENGRFYFGKMGSADVEPVLDFTIFDDSWEVL